MMWIGQFCCSKKSDINVVLGKWIEGLCVLANNNTATSNSEFIQKLGLDNSIFNMVVKKKFATVMAV
ncbi:Hypothetical protein SRAE_0000038100 [Strongyloides ratti]|uniref:Uncharacterized protein n=1 Tax=Strongyloides ratti TaxID=34506 RepID=A0A090KUT6_STRRB|nr:Hypothetical protein SRAE_0000038100 [Strongyloides ratti]CEF61255.1 Hypothetical protein SRAE_0000038100 [Strongyloides ratti]